MSPDENTFAMPSAPQPEQQPAGDPALENMQTVTSGETVGFMKIVKDSLGVLRKKLFTFLGLTLLMVIIIGAGYVFILPLIFISALAMGPVVMIAGTVVFGLIQGMFLFLFYGAIAGQAASAIHDNQVKVGESLNTAFKNIGKAIALTFRIFLYSGLWVIFAVLVLFALSPMLFQSTPMVLIIGNFVLGAVGLISILVASIRAIRTTMAFPLLMADPEISAKEALDESLRITKGKWWLVYCFLTVFPVLIGLVPLVINVLGAVTGVAIINTVAVIASAIFGILSYSLTVTFFQVLANSLGDSSKQVKLHIGVIISAILIFLAPLILGFAFASLIPALLKNIYPTGSVMPSTYTPTSGFLQQTSQEQTAGTIDPAAVKVRDEQRIENLKTLLAYIEKYHASTGVYPDETHCVGDIFTEKWPYLKGTERIGNVFSASGRTASINYYDYRNGENLSCGTIFVTFGGDNFALLTGVEDKANGNTEEFLKELDAAVKAAPTTKIASASKVASATTDPYYAILHLAASAEPESATQGTVPATQEDVTPGTLEQTQATIPVSPTAPKVKRAT
jgi:hypothetical protein